MGLKWLKLKSNLALENNKSNLAKFMVKSSNKKASIWNGCQIKNFKLMV